VSEASWAAGHKVEHRRAARAQRGPATSRRSGCPHAALLRRPQPAQCPPRAASSPWPTRWRLTRRGAT